MSQIEASKSPLTNAMCAIAASASGSDGAMRLYSDLGRPQRYREATTMAKRTPEEPKVYPTILTYNESLTLKGGDLRVSDLRELAEAAHMYHFPDDSTVNVSKYPSIESFTRLEPPRDIITITPPKRTVSNG